MPERARVTETKAEARIGPTAGKDRTPEVRRCPTTPREQLLYLQRTVGNRALRNLPKSGQFNSVCLKNVSKAKPSQKIYSVQLETEEEDKLQPWHLIQKKENETTIGPLNRKQSVKETEGVNQAHRGNDMALYPIRVRRQGVPSLQCDSLNPLVWARDLLNSISGDASAQEAQVSSDASARAGELESQSTARNTELQGQSAAQGTALQSEASAQGGQLDQRSTSQAAALQSQAGAQGALLSGESSKRAAALQQEAGATSTRLQGDVGALEIQARSVETTTESTLNADVGAIQGEAKSSTSLVQGQWQMLETKTTGRLSSLTSRTQALADQKAALMSEYESPGRHDPERFQSRWAALQGQIGPLEQEQSSLEGVEGSGEALNDRAGTIWTNLSNRGQALLSNIAGVAGSAWNALQSRWSTLQGTAATALAALQGKANAAVDGLKALATSAWTGLQGTATQAWNGLKGMASSAWTALQNRATAAWTALQSQATSAWTALQSVASSVVAGLADKISGIISRINGAVGRIIQLIASAVESLLSRLRSATGTALNFLRSRAGAAWNAVKSLGARAWTGLKDLGTRAWEGLKSLGTRAWEGLKDLGTRAWEGLKDLGARAWEGLKNLGQRAWNGLKSGWEWLKKKAQAAWEWLKRAWGKLKRKAAQLWDWIKRKAREALAWLKRKWAWLKTMLRKVWAWLKAKWKWLKSLVKIPRRLDFITMKRKHIHLTGPDKYGHWWTEIDGSKSYGWWPKYPVGLKDTFFGTVGELNGQTTFGGTPTKDPHHGDPGEEEFHPVLIDPSKADSTVRAEVDSFSTGYSGEWRWTFGYGQNCHTFQISLMSTVGLKEP